MKHLLWIVPGLCAVTVVVSQESLPSAPYRAPLLGELEKREKKRGEVLFRKTCAPCHQARSEEDSGGFQTTMQYPTSLSEVQKTEEEWRKRIASGSESEYCPPWKWTYSEGDIQRISRYLMQRQKENWGEQRK